MIYLQGDKQYDEVARKLEEAGHEVEVVTGWPMGLSPGDMLILASSPLDWDAAEIIRAYRAAGIKVVLEDKAKFDAPPTTERLRDTYDVQPAQTKAGTVHFVASDRGGSGRWRSAWPATVLEDAGYRVVVEVSSVWAEKYRPTPDDLVIAHRPEFSSTWLEVQRKLQGQGVTVLVDEDDDITAIPLTFDPRFRRAASRRMEAHDQAIREADGLIVSTPRLEEVYGTLAKRTWVMPNLIPEWVSHAASKLDPNVVRVGWAGMTRTHLHDLLWLKPEIHRALEGATFTSVGDDTTPVALGLEPERCETRGVIYDPTLFYRAMSRADIGIVPLDPVEPLNWSKSNIKLLEYQSLGRPVVGVKLPEQEKLVLHGETGFLAETPQEFAGYVHLLVRDRDMRERMGRAGQERARDFTLQARGQQWLGLIEEVREDHMPRVRHGDSGRQVQMSEA